ncbi:transposase [Brevibacillus nitrificans]|uniref:Transposase n=1 Tax=Brevibacillus nitrificans TaxID=651560 RepID=A0A3M8D2M2_9BACL|nr:TnsD family Tn7-like transposition protein [Brevibacillus nitrificans]RNB82118.1 transposase [Brevibacillus nitrificans]
MLPFFPTPYPDELMYSVCARYHLWSRNVSYKETMFELFTSRTATAVIDLPNRINHLFSQLPVGTTNTPDKLIRLHTLFPLYCPFLSNEKSEMVNTRMKTSITGNIHNAIGIMASSIPSLPYLRYCPKCMESDSEKYGEPYWHRSHQIFGVNLCPIHFAPLFNTEILVTSRQNKHSFQILSDQIVQRDTEKIYMTSLDHQIAIAKAAFWLLNNEPPSIGLVELRNHYLSYLNQAGLMTVTGRVRQKLFISKFNELYGPSFLDDVNSAVSIACQDNWLMKLVRSPRSATHPIRHILLMLFLGITPQVFFKKDVNNIGLPFGNGPWPCLNAAASHYRKKTINTNITTRDSKMKVPVGTFSCSCGFTYSRRGPDHNETDHYKIGRIKNFGPVWEAKLKDLSKKKYSLRHMARHLKVDPQTIKNQLRRLEDQNDVDISKMAVEKQQSLDQRRQLYRDSWIELMNTNPGKTKTQLRLLAQAEFTWLYRNDHDWLTQHSPQIKEAGSSPRECRVNWELRDDYYQERVLETIEGMRNSSQKPIRITVSFVAKKIGQLSRLQKNFDKLPKTRRVLNDVVESRDTFQMNRVKYAHENMLRTGIKVAKWKLERLSGLKPGYSKQVVELVEELVMMNEAYPSSEQFGEY